MKNKSIKFDEEVFIKGKNSEKIYLSNGYVISYYHQQDCCEEVYAEFDNIELEKAIEDKFKFNKIMIKNVEQIGFILILDTKKILINCYNEQNGYYSDELLLIIKDKYGNNVLQIDIDKEDDIY